ncbi:MAG TPA: ParB/Srx family N-terminal domain-containing protein, partial [Bacteroidia bacterium]|nr:ParB/Srx family N-terminal domain-containing protein [Bacteroidia bacterium]
MAKTQKIKLLDLLVNTENYRFEPVASQKEAIDQMINEQTEKLYNLAEHIIQHGINPNDKIQVVVSNHDKTKYNVVEGNRRTVALKILNNPDLIEGSVHVNLKKKFRKLHDNNKASLVKEIDCTVYENPAEADKWIKLKHAGESVGTVRWNAQQVQRFEEKVEGKSSVALQTIKILQNSSDVPKELKSNLTNLKITNLDRLISDPDVRDTLGIKITNGVIQSDIEQKEVIKGLTQVAKDLLNPKFKVGEIYTKEDRKDYLKKFPKSSKPDVSKKASKPWQYNDTSSSSSSKPSPKPKPNPNDRDVLIPKSCVIKIGVAKVNAIYHELQKLSVTKYTNAVSVTLRVFVELSVD